MGTGSKIKAILKEQKKTIKQLSQESGVSLNTLYSITKRDSAAVTAPVLEKVAQALQVPVFSLLPEKQATEALIGIDNLIKYFENEYNNPESEHYHSETFRNKFSQDTLLHTALEEAIQDISFDQMDKAQELADQVYVDAMEGLSDRYIKKIIDNAFRFLNRRGKIEAMLRILELEENHRFHIDSSTNDDEYEDDKEESGKE